MVQLTPLLFAVAEQIDGRRQYPEIAAAASDQLGRQLDPDGARLLVEEKLRPLGIATEADGSTAEVDKPDPLLALRFRKAILSERAVRIASVPFKPFFLGPAVLAIVTAVVALDVWLFFSHGVAEATREILYQPALMLAMLGLVVASAAFHEFGHAAALAYSGGTPGVMGAGIYLAWPAFYTDVTDAYRCSRAGRLRTDLGGVYFNAIFILGTYAAYFLTDFEPLLVVILVQHIEVLHQLLPLLRLDGYYIVADLVGVPDLFARIKPIVVSMLPWRQPDAGVTALKRWVRVVVSAWVLVVVPLLLFNLFMLLLHFPRILGTAIDSAGRQLETIKAGFSDGKPLHVAAGIAQVLILFLPIVGIVYSFARLGRRIAGRAWHWGDDSVPRRALVAGTGVAVAAALVWNWLPTDNYEPIRRGERGTVHEAISATRAIPRGRAPLVTRRAAEQRGELRPEPPGEPTTTSTTATTPSSITETTLVTDASGGGPVADDTTTTTGEASTTTSSTTSATTTSSTTSSSTTSPSTTSSLPTSSSPTASTTASTTSVGP